MEGESVVVVGPSGVVTVAVAMVGLADCGCGDWEAMAICSLWTCVSEERERSERETMIRIPKLEV